MGLKVPDFEIIKSILDVHFSETEEGGWAREDDSGGIYIFNKDGSIYAFISVDTWFELLDYKEESKEENAK